MRTLSLHAPLTIPPDLKRHSLRTAKPAIAPLLHTDSSTEGAKETEAIDYAERKHTQPPPSSTPIDIDSYDLFTVYASHLLAVFNSYLLTDDIWSRMALIDKLNPIYCDHQITLAAYAIISDSLTKAPIEAHLCSNKIIDDQWVQKLSAILETQQEDIYQVAISEKARQPTLKIIQAYPVYLFTYESQQYAFDHGINALFICRIVAHVKATSDDDFADFAAWILLLSTLVPDSGCINNTDSNDQSSGHNLHRCEHLLSIACPAHVLNSVWQDTVIPPQVQQ